MVSFEAASFSMCEQVLKAFDASEKQGTTVVERNVFEVKSFPENVNNLLLKHSSRASVNSSWLRALIAKGGPKKHYPTTTMFIRKM